MSFFPKAEICEEFPSRVSVMISWLDQVSACLSCLMYRHLTLVAVKICIANSRELSFWNLSEWLNLIFLPTVLKFSYLSVTVVVLSVLVSSRLVYTKLWFHSSAIPHSVKGRHSYLRKRKPFRTRESLGVGWGWGVLQVYLEVHEAVQGWFMGFHSCRTPGGFLGKVICLNLCKEHLDHRGWEFFFLRRPACFQWQACSAAWFPSCWIWVFLHVKFVPLVLFGSVWLNTFSGPDNVRCDCASTRALSFINE